MCLRGGRANGDDLEKCVQLGRLLCRTLRSRTLIPVSRYTLLAGSVMVRMVGDLPGPGAEGALEI